MLSREEERVLMKIARVEGNYRSAILPGMDLDTAGSLVAGGLAFHSGFDDWFNLTDRGRAMARQLVGSRA